MDFSKTIYSLIGVLVAVIMIATVAMPAITSASTTTTTTTTTEIQDVEVSDPIYYSDTATGMMTVRYSADGTPSIVKYYNGDYAGYTFSGDFVSVPILISDTVVSILCKDENGCYVYSSGYASGGTFVSDKIMLDASHTVQITVYSSDGKVDIMRAQGGSPTGGVVYANTSWHYYVSIPQIGGNYITSLSQQSVLLGSLNEIVAGSAYYVNTNVVGFAYVRNGEQTQSGDYALIVNSVQTDEGNVDVSLKASYDDTEVLVLVPTTTEVNVTQTITVQTEHAPILNVVLLMLLIVPVTAVVAILYTRRD